MFYILTGILFLLATTIAIIIVRRNDIRSIQIGISGFNIKFYKRDAR